ncbi:MAG: glutamate-cysteine ligase family protein [Planctomycetota bacterium]
MTSNRPVRPGELEGLLDELVLGRPMPSGERLLGVEYERLLLDRVDRTSAPLDFCRQLMIDLVDDLGAEPIVEGPIVKGLDSARFAMSMEPGGQLEVASPPCRRLAEIDACMDAATAAIERRLEGTRFELAALGHAPVTPVEQLGLLPRERYRIMDATMPSRGPLTRNMMRATAGSQLTYDVRDREDAGKRLALLYRFSPVLLALSANSREVAGRDSGYASFRHHVWWETDRDRSGIPAGCLHPETAIEGYLRYAADAQVLFLERDGVVVRAPEGSLEDLVRAGVLTVADVALHLSGLFPFVRLRNYIEVRCFDALPWPECRSLLALVSGLIYCDHAFDDASALSEALVVDAPAALRALPEKAARDGLDASAPDGRSFRDLAGDMIGIARATLGSETCDWAEPADLDAAASRLSGA